MTIEADYGKFELIIEDEGDGGDDSHAFLESVDGINTILNQKIISVDESYDSSYGASIDIFTHNGRATILITHEHNGYYGFSYELREV